MKNRVVLIILPLAILAVALATGSIVISRLFFLSVLVLLLSYLWTRLGIRGISGQARQSSGHCQVGEWFEEEFTIFNRSKIPKLLLQVQENSDLPGYQNMLGLNLSSGGYHHWQTRVYCQRRGQYSLGTLSVTVTDPFGLFTRQRNLGKPQKLLVYPATLALPFFQPLSRSEPGYGYRHGLIGEASPNAARVREYVNGDTLNRIHWRSMAHTGKLMVKVFDSDRSEHAFKNIWVIPDMHRASQPGNGSGAMEEYCVTIAASLIKKYIDSGKRVGLMAMGDQSYLFPPRLGNQHLWHLLEVLALMKPTGEVPMEQLLSNEIGRFDINSLIIIITPSTSEQITASLRHIENRGAMVVAILLDHLSFDGTGSMVNAASSLVSSGLEVYVIRGEDELTRALDSRAVTRRMRWAKVV